MNILILNHTSGIGGAARSLAMSVKVLCAADSRVHILSPNGPMCDAFDQMGAEVAVWDPPSCYWLWNSIISTAQSPMSLSNLLKLLRLPLLLIRGALLIRRLVDQASIDAIYVNSVVLFPVGILLKMLKRKRKVRVMWHLREVINSELPSPIYRWIIQSIAGSSDQILAITNNEALPFNGYNVTVIHNTIETSWLENWKPGEKTEVPLRVCMASAFQTGKGIPDFLQMAKTVLKGIPQAICVLYTTSPGGGRIDHFLCRFIRYLSPVARLLSVAVWKFQEISLDRNILCVFDHQMTREEFVRCSVYVRADETGSPWGRDIIEAMCSGLPIVATGTCQEFVLDGETGFLVPPRRPDLLARSVERLLRDPELRKSMGEAARMRAEELFAPEMFAQKLLKAFDLEGE